MGALSGPRVFPGAHVNLSLRLQINDICTNHHVECVLGHGLRQEVPLQMIATQFFEDCPLLFGLHAFRSCLQPLGRAASLIIASTIARLSSLLAAEAVHEAFVDLDTIDCDIL